MTHRFLLTAAAATTAACVLATGAGATAQPAAAPRSVISVTTTDAAHDVHVQQGADAPRRVSRSVELRHVHYRIDRAHGVLEITYPVRRVLATGGAYQQYFVSVAGPDLRDDSAPSVSFLTLMTTRPHVLVLGNEAAGDGIVTTCRRAGVAVSRARDTVVQRVPFSCFSSGVDHGFLRSAAGVEARRGADVAFDVTRSTRDLPLSPLPSR